MQIMDGTIWHALRVTGEVDTYCPGIIAGEVEALMLRSGLVVESETIDDLLVSPRPEDGPRIRVVISGYYLRVHRSVAAEVAGMLRAAAPWTPWRTPCLRMGARGAQYVMPWAWRVPLIRVLSAP